ncbi:Uncharacterised protein [Chlamydia abortus]|nr:Uncharacterised protein [Chlamydia abortus]
MAAELRCGGKEVLRVRGQDRWTQQLPPGLPEALCSHPGGHGLFHLRHQDSSPPPPSHHPFGGLAQEAFPEPAGESPAVPAILPER